MVVRVRRAFILAFAIGAGIWCQPHFTDADAGMARAADGKPVATDEEKRAALDDGIYLIIRQDQAEAKVEPVSAGEQLLVNDYHFLPPEEREPKRYVVLQEKPFIPIILASDPQKDVDDKGKPKLGLELERSQIKPLEDFTRKNLGGSIAIVIGGEIVTTHKIRTVITGGKIQITRCADSGCEAIYTRLKERQQKSTD